MKVFIVVKMVNYEPLIKRVFDSLEKAEKFVKESQYLACYIEEHSVQ